MKRKSLFSHFQKLLFFFLLFHLPNFSSAQLTYKHLYIQYDSPWIYRNLKLIPIRFQEFGNGNPSQFEEGIIGFNAAIREGKLSVKETRMSGGADISLLRVKNHSKQSVLVHSGEIVTGGKQDRIFASTTLILPNKKEQLLPVYCVEKGRWDRRPSRFRYGGMADAALRKQMDLTHKQYKIWREIDRRLAMNNKKNETWAYINLFTDSTSIDTDTSYLQFYNRKMRETDSAYAGFVAITGDRIINCELFGNSELCLASYESMIQSYARSLKKEDGTENVADKTVNVADKNVKEFLDKFLQTEDQQKEYLRKHGKMFLYEKMVIHLVAYPEEKIIE